MLASKPRNVDITRFHSQRGPRFWLRETGAVTKTDVCRQWCHLSDLVLHALREPTELPVVVHSSRRLRAQQRPLSPRLNIRSIHPHFDHYQRLSICILH